MLHQMMLNADGRRRGSVVGYAASRSSESYSSEQQVVEFRSSSPRFSSPKKIMDYKDPETFSRGSPFLVPWSSPRAGNNDVDHRVQEFSPRKASPPKYGSNDRRGGVFQEFSPRKANYGNNDHRVVQEFSPQKASSPNYGKSSEQCFHGNKQADYYSGNYKGYDDDSEYEEEDDDDYYDYDDDGLKGKNHVRDDHIREDMMKGKSHYDSSSGKSKHNQGINSYNHNNNTQDPPYNDKGKYYKGNEYSSSPRNSNHGAGPFSNKPKKETYYEPSSHGGPIGNNNNSGLTPIKTRPTYNANRVTDYPDEAERRKNTNPNKATQQPKFNSSAAGSKDQRETIDSTEARRRYGRSSPRAGPTVEERYTNTIDSREAARRYNGVFVP